MAKAESNKTDNVLMHVGPRIKKWRKAKDWTQLQLAQAAGCSKGHVSGIENCHGNLSITKFLAICDALGVPPARILGQHRIAKARDIDALAGELIEALGIGEIRWLAGLSTHEASEAMARARERVTVLRSTSSKKTRKLA